MGCKKGRFLEYYGGIFPANPNAAGVTTEYGTEEKLLREVYPLVLFFEIALSGDLQDFGGNGHNHNRETK